MNNEQQQEDTKRKQYDTPRLVVYGDIARLTEKNLNKTHVDGPSNHMS